MSLPSRFVAAVVLAALAGCSRPAETIPATRLTQITRTDAANLPGQILPARTDTTVVWLAADRTRRDAGRQSFVLRADDERMLMIDRAESTYVDVSLREASKLMADLAAAPDTATHPRDRLLHSMVHLGAKVTATDDQERLDGHDCRRYIVELHLGETHIVSEQWVTGDLQIDDRLLRRASFATLLGLPGAAEALAELARIEGVPVRTTTITTMFDREIRAETRLAEVVAVQVAADHFAPPAGFQAIATALPIPESPAARP